MKRPTKLSDDAIRDILTCPASAGVLAQRHGVHRSAVGYIRQGKTHADRLPELPRWTVTCDRCIHWAGRCDLGHVDPEEEGVSFARDCASFVQR
jgi:hypothetical protein